MRVGDGGGREAGAEVLEVGDEAAERFRQLERLGPEADRDRPVVLVDVVGGERDEAAWGSAKISSTQLATRSRRSSVVSAAAGR